MTGLVADGAAPILVDVKGTAKMGWIACVVGIVSTTGINGVVADKVSLNGCCSE